MKTWKLALVGLATLSTSAFAAPVMTGSASAVTTASELVSVPDLGGDEIVIVTNKLTGEISVRAADGTLVPTTPTTKAQAQKVCYGGPCGLNYGPGNGYLGYGGGYGVPPVVVEEEEYVNVRRYRRREIAPGYGYGGGYAPGAGYRGGYGPGPGYDEGY